VNHSALYHSHRNTQQIIHLCPHSIVQLYEWTGCEAAGMGRGNRCLGQ